MSSVAHETIEVDKLRKIFMKIRFCIFFFNFPFLLKPSLMFVCVPCLIGLTEKWWTLLLSLTTIGNRKFISFPRANLAGSLAGVFCETSDCVRRKFVRLS